MKNKKGVIVGFSLVFLGALITGILFNVYGAFNDKNSIIITDFNSLLLKSIVISLVIVMVLFIVDYKRIKLWLKIS